MSKEFVGVTAQVVMSRTLYLERKENETDSQFMERAKKEIVLPHNAIMLADSTLKRVGVRVNGLDLGDWNVENVEYKLLNNEQLSNDDSIGTGESSMESSGESREGN